MVEVVIHKDRTVTKLIPDSLRGLTKKLAYGDYTGFPAFAMSHDEISRKLLNQICLHIHCECQDLTASGILHGTDAKAVIEFSYQDMTAELLKRYPIMMSCLGAISQPNRASRYADKSERSAAVNSFAAFCLLKQRSDHFATSAAINSIVLYRGHANRMVGTN